MTPATHSIRRASLDDLELVAPLFDLYRQFYEQAPDTEGARTFIRERLEREESVIFLALGSTDGTSEPAGFAQLYPIFSSVGMVRVWLLNDLYVHPEHRRTGVARALMMRVIDHALETGYARVELATAEDNVEARALYEDLGFAREEGFLHYALRL